MKTFEQDDGSDDEPDSGHVAHVFVVAHQVKQAPVKTHKNSFKHFKCKLNILVPSSLHWTVLILFVSFLYNGVSLAKIMRLSFLGCS